MLCVRIGRRYPPRRQKPARAVQPACNRQTDRHMATADTALAQRRAGKNYPCTCNTVTAHEQNIYGYCLFSESFD